MARRQDDIEMMREDAYKAPTCVYKYIGLDNQEHKINPYTFITRGVESGCTAALERFLKNIDTKKIHEIIDDIPQSIGETQIMPDAQKEFYKRVLDIRLEEVFIPAFELLHQKQTSSNTGNDLAFEIEQRVKQAKAEIGTTTDEERSSSSS